MPVRYVVAGDWVVDENWFLVRHYSETSKHTGREHFRLASQRFDKILDLCGVGHVARVLHHLAGLSKPREFHILALGNWDAADRQMLTHLVHSEGGSDSDSEREKCRAGVPMFRLEPDRCKLPVEGITLHALRSGPTIRAIRLYQLAKDDWELLYRVDWEPEPTEPDPATLPANDRRRRRDALREPEPDDDVPVLVIDDMEKGAIDEHVIKRLLDLYPNADWFVRAKELPPAWLELIPKARRRLFVIGPEIAPHRSPFERWHEQGSVTAEGIRVLNIVAARNVVLLSDRRELIGKFEIEHTTVDESEFDYERLDFRVISGKSEVPPTAIAQVGWADAVMAGLVHAMTRSTGNAARRGRAHVVRSADIAAALRAADDPERGARPPGAAHLGSSPDPTIVRTEGWTWKREQDVWIQATHGFGLIGPEPVGDAPDRRELHVWRASARLRGYIACIPEKLNILDAIGGSLRAFSRGSVARPVGVLVQSDPGTGKTHLARCLADAFGFTLLNCDIAQMVHREELFDFFDRVGTQQASDPDTPVLAFVDEINATIEGSPVYGAFLSPLESGVYARRGRLFTLKPCVWLFTGTKVASIGVEEKLSDFRSRMTLIEKIDYQSLLSLYPEGLPDGRVRREAITSAARLEQVYLSAAMINNYFPDVTKIDLRLIERFHSLDPASSPFREIRQTVVSLRNVKHGKVEMNNLPESSPLRTADAREPAKHLINLAFKPATTANTS